MYLDDLDEDEYEIAIKVSEAADATADAAGRKAAMQQLFCPKFGLTVFFRVRLGGLAVCCSLAPSFSRLLPVLCCAVYVRVCVCIILPNGKI